MPITEYHKLQAKCILIVCLFNCLFFWLSWNSILQQYICQLSVLYSLQSKRSHYWVRDESNFQQDHSRTFHGALLPEVTFLTAVPKAKPLLQKKHESLHQLIKASFPPQRVRLASTVTGSSPKAEPSPGYKIRSSQGLGWGDSHTKDQRVRNGAGKEWEDRPEIQVKAPIPDPLWLKIILKNTVKGPRKIMWMVFYFMF